jgi:hypothetical protein
LNPVEAEGFEQLQNHLQFRFRLVGRKIDFEGIKIRQKSGPLPIGQRAASALGRQTGASDVLKIAAPWKLRCSDDHRITSVPPALINCRANRRARPYGPRASSSCSSRQDIYVYPLVRDARQQLCTNFVR